MKFIELDIKGFRSIKSAKINFDTNGITFVKGLNGSGKSTIFEALYWALYGDLLKDTTLEKITPRNEEGYMGTRCALAFELDGQEYVIARHKKYTGKTFGIKSPRDKLLVYKDGEMIGDAQHKADQQELITSLIGVSKDVFKNSILFCQEGYRIVDGSDSEKKAFFNAVFNLDYLDSYATRAKDKVADIENNLATYTQSATVLSVKKAGLVEQLESIDEAIAKFEADKVADAQKWEELLRVTDNTLAELKSRVISDLPEYKPDTTKTKLEGLRDQIKGALDIRPYVNALEKHKKALKQLSDTCPTCGGKIQNDDAKATLEAAVKEAAAEYADVTSKNAQINEHNAKIRAAIVEVEGSAKEVVAYNKEVDKVIQEQEDIKAKLDHTVHNCTMYKNSIANIAARKFPIDPRKIQADLDEIDIKLGKISKNIVPLEKELEATTWWAKVGFGHKGLKAHVFDMMLRELNDALVRYATPLQMHVSLGVDLSKKSKGIDIECRNISGETISYSELSGGEKRRIDIAISFALNDIIRDKFCASNIMIMDEMFTALDEKGLYEALELIQFKAEDQAVFVVTHSMNVDCMYSKTLEVINENGISWVK